MIARRWDFAESRDVTAWRDLVTAAESAGVVVRDEWDDGRGACPWYIARPGADEDALYAACCAALGASSPVDDLAACDRGRLVGEVMRLRAELSSALLRLAEVVAERDAALRLRAEEGEERPRRG